MATRGKYESDVLTNNKSPWRHAPKARHAIVAFVLSAAMAACGAANLEQRPHGTPDLSKAFPTPTASPFGLSQGHRGAGITARLHGLGAAPNADSKRDSAVREVALTRSRPRPAHVVSTPPRAQALSDSKAVSSAAAEPATARNAAAARQASVIADSQRYAERQNSSRNLEQYRGGDRLVVIGASTLIIVLLVVLLLVLLL
jgi:hypothetical protein